MVTRVFISDIKKMLPSGITLLNAASGLFAIILGFVSFSSGQLYFFDYAFYLIIWCVFLDIMDGFLARKFEAKSELGAKLDSKSDAVSFGVAPAVFLAFASITLFNSYTMILSVIIAIYYLCSALFRLALFDITKPDNDDRGHMFFSGFPSPPAALICTGACVAVVNFELNIFYCWFIYIMTAYLMTSKIKYPDLPKHYYHKVRSYLELIPVVILFFFVPLAYFIIITMTLYEFIPLVRKWAGK